MYTLIHLISLYHDTLLTRSLRTSLPKVKLSANTIPSPSTARQPPHTRYTLHHAHHTPLYTRLARSLQVLQYTELLLEMLAKRRGGNRTRWRAVVLIEAVKAFIRLWILQATARRPLTTPLLPGRDEPGPLPESEEEKLERLEREVEGLRLEEGGTNSSWKMPRTKLVLPPLPGSGKNDITSYLLSAVLTPEDLKPALTLLPPLGTSTAVAAELLYILRPLVYAAAMYRYRDRRADWGPWLLGLSMEVASWHLGKAERDRVGARGYGSLDRAEGGRRGWEMGWWALRGAGYETFTRPWLKSIEGKMRGKLGLDLLSGIVSEYDYLWGEYYFSTSSM